MGRVSEVVKEELKSKGAWATAIALIPATLFACYVYFAFAMIYLSSEGRFSNESYSLFGAMTVFIIGVCVDQAAHIICCCNGSKSGVILRVCASIFETLGVVWWIVLMFTLFPEMTNWRNLLAASETLVLVVPLVLSHMLIALWKILETISLVQYAQCLSGKFKGNVILNFGAVGMIVCVGFFILSFIAALTYIKFFPFDRYGASSALSTGLFIFGFSAIPVYIISLSLQSFRTADAVAEIE